MPSNQEVIDLLRIDKEYYTGIGRNYFSNSDIGVLLNNPRMYGVPQEEILPFLMGRLFHTAILEPDKARMMIAKAVDVGSRNTKAYREAVSQGDGSMLLLTKEIKAVETMVKSMLGNMDFFDLIRGDNVIYEQPAIGVIMGQEFKGKADIITDDYVIDLKTTGSIEKFKWSAKTYGYDSQAFIYQKLFGKPMKFLVVDKTTFELGMYDPSSEFLTRGQDRVEEGLRVHAQFFGDNPTHNIDEYYRYDNL
mgnify:CR=1 FL=1